MELTNAVSRNFELVSLYGQEYMRPVFYSRWKMFSFRIMRLVMSLKPGLALKILKKHILHYKVEDFNNFKLNDKDIIQIAEEKDFSLNDQSKTFAIMILVLSKKSDVSK